MTWQTVSFDSLLLGRTPWICRPLGRLGVLASICTILSHLRVCATHRSLLGASRAPFFHRANVPRLHAHIGPAAGPFSHIKKPIHNATQPELLCRFRRPADSILAALQLPVSLSRAVVFHSCPTSVEYPHSSSSLYSRAPLASDALGAFWPVPRGPTTAQSGLGS